MTSPDAFNGAGAVAAMLGLHTLGLEPSDLSVPLLFWRFP